MKVIDGGIILNTNNNYLDSKQAIKLFYENRMNSNYKKYER